MPKFFPQILKQKKIIFFIVLFSVVTGLLVPIITRAEISLENGFSLIYIDLMRFISGLFQKYADISSLLLGKVIAELIEAPITTSTLVLSGWGMVRDLANMLIVLGFVIIGIATTLRIRDYEAKKLLPYLIIIALLINFSPLIIGVIIDSSTLAMNSLMGGGALSGKFGRGIYLDINVPYYELFVDAYSQLAATEKQDFTIKVIMFSFMFFIIGTTFLYYVFIFFERYIMLLILSIISPLAFFAWIFPATRKHFNNWVEQLIKWAFIGIAGAFFINIATGLLNLYEQNKTDIIPTDLLHSPDLFYLVNVCLLLFIGLKVTKKNSGVIAGSIMGLAGTAVGMAAGYATGGASLLAKGGLKAAGRGADAATGGRLSATGQKISSGVGRTMERMGLRKEGVTGMKEGGRIAEEQKRYEAMFKSGNASDKERAKQAAKTGRGVNRAGAYAAAAATNNLNDTYRRADGTVNTEEMYRGLVHTEQFGAGENLRKQTLKENPMVAALDDKKIDENITKLGYPNRLQAGTQGLAKAKTMAITDAVQKTNPGDAAKWTPDIMTPEVFAGLRKNQLIEMGKRGTPGLVEKVKKYRRTRDESTGALLAPDDPGQNEEYKALKRHIDTTYGRPSPERDKVVELIKELERTNSVFS